MSMSQKNPPSLMKSVEEVAMPSTVEGILTVLRRVLSKPYVQSISLKSGRPMEIVWHKDISDSLKIGDPEDSSDLVLSRVALEEFSSSGSPKECLVDAIMFLNQRNMHATHMFVGSVDFVRDWVGIPQVVSLPRFEGTGYLNFLGIQLCEVTSLENDVIVLLGAESAGATRTEILRGLKIVT